MIRKKTVTGKKFILLILTFVVTLCVFVPVGNTVQAKEVDPTQYTYSVTPLISPFNGYIYVKTDNPDPQSFRLADKSSALKLYWDSTFHIPQEEFNNIARYFQVSKNIYADVEYEDKTIYRVKGGYIFEDYTYACDGGELTLQKRNGNTNEYVDTGVKIKCPQMESPEYYLINRYTDSGMDFFEKLSSIENNLKDISLYPRPIVDTDKKTDINYPALMTSIHEDITWLAEEYNFYETYTDGSLLRSAHPYILNSASFPFMMGRIAKILEPSCSVVDNPRAHYLMDITYKGETRAYGYAGQGNSNPVYNTDIKDLFRFDSSSGDFFNNKSLEAYSKKYKELGKNADNDIAEMRKLITGENFVKAIGPGNWIKTYIPTGYYSYLSRYSYVAASSTGGTYLASDAWVDGRYIDTYERWEKGAKFSDHPHALIILRNVSYTDKKGNKHTGDIVYYYYSASNIWAAPGYYTNEYIEPANMNSLPDRFKLTEEQVRALNVDKKTNDEPLTGLIYDGSAYPGTPFENVFITSFSLKEKAITIHPDEEITLTPVFKPENATNKKITWSTGNGNIAKVDKNGKVTCGTKAGTTTITAKTEDGGKIATVQVTSESRPGLTIYYTSKVLSVGEETTYFAVPKPYSTDRTATWSSSDPTVVSVDNKGNIKALRPGKVIITAVAPNGTKDECEVRVNFVDVTNTGLYYYKPVYWAAENKITTGSNGLFAPHNSCTREHAITFLWRMAGSPQPKSMVSKFKDVQNKNSYSYKAIMWGTEKGIITGSGGKFAPNNTCTREQIVTMLWRLAGKPAPKSTSSKFKDVKNKNSYSYKAILWASEKGITTGSNGEFKPGKTCTRAEIVTFIYRYKNTVK